MFRHGAPIPLLSLEAFLLPPTPATSILLLSSCKTAEKKNLEVTGIGNSVQTKLGAE